MRKWVAACALLFSALPLFGQANALPSGNVTVIFRDLLAQIEKIPIFDDHSHPGYADDPDVDAMAAPPGSSALRLRTDNPELIAASKALFQYPYSDNSPDHMRWLIDKKKELKSTEGSQYFDRILDQLGIETVIANRVAMPDYLDRKRFLWAFFVDSFLFPFDNRAIRERNIDEQTYIPLQEKKLQREMKQANLAALPQSLNGYLAFVTRILEEDARTEESRSSLKLPIFARCTSLIRRRCKQQLCMTNTMAGECLPRKSTLFFRTLSSAI